MPQELYKSRNERTTRESLIPLTYILEMIFTKLTFFEKGIENILNLFSAKYDIFPSLNGNSRFLM